MPLPKLSYEPPFLGNVKDPTIAQALREAWYQIVVVLNQVSEGSSSAIYQNQQSIAGVDHVTTLIQAIPIGFGLQLLFNWNRADLTQMTTIDQGAGLGGNSVTTAVTTASALATFLAPYVRVFSGGGVGPYHRIIWTTTSFPTDATHELACDIDVSGNAGFGNPTVGNGQGIIFGTDVNNFYFVEFSAANTIQVWKVIAGTAYQQTNTTQGTLNPIGADNNGQAQPRSYVVIGNDGRLRYITGGYVIVDTDMKQSGNTTVINAGHFGFAQCVGNHISMSRLKVWWQSSTAPLL